MKKIGIGIIVFLLVLTSYSAVAPIGYGSSHYTEPTSNSFITNEQVYILVMHTNTK